MPISIEARDQSPFYLPNILGVAPDSDSRCVGFARTTGQRCRLPASDIRGRAHASRVLDEGTRILESGEENIDEVLEELAPLLLCNRHHQWQAGGLVYDWSRKVEKFHERRHASARFLSRSPSPAAYRGGEAAQRFGTSRMAQTTTEVSYQRQISRTYVVETLLAERRDYSRSIRTSSASHRINDTEQHDTSPTTAMTMNQFRGHTPRIPLGSTTPRPSSEFNLQEVSRQYVEERVNYELERLGLYTDPSSSNGTNDVSHGSSDSPTRTNNQEPRTTVSRSGTSRPLPRMTVRNPRITVSESTRRQRTTASSTRSAQESSEAETSTPTSREPSRPARNPARQRTSRSGEVTRRHVEGECSICFLPLLDDDSDTPEGHEVEHDDDSSEHDEEESEDRHEFQNGHEDLVWCRKQCGNNFHRDCMDSWIRSFERRFEESARQPTCPICRAEWEE